MPYDSNSAVRYNRKDLATAVDWLRRQGENPRSASEAFKLVLQHFNELLARTNEQKPIETIKEADAILEGFSLNSSGRGMKTLLNRLKEEEGSR
jgi:hypothetical protein